MLVLDPVTFVESLKPTPFFDQRYVNGPVPVAVALIVALWPVRIVCDVGEIATVGVVTIVSTAALLVADAYALEAMTE